MTEQEKRTADGNYRGACCVTGSSAGFWTVLAWKADSRKEYSTVAYIDYSTGKAVYVDDAARTDACVQKCVQDEVEKIKRRHPIVVSKRIYEKDIRDAYEHGYKEGREDALTGACAKWIPASEPPKKQDNYLILKLQDMSYKDREVVYYTSGYYSNDRFGTFLFDIDSEWDSRVKDLKVVAWKPELKEGLIKHGIKQEEAFDPAPQAAPETTAPENRKKGSWIVHEDADIVDGYYVPSYECPFCRAWKDDDSSYCPDCGADLR